MRWGDDEPAISWRVTNQVLVRHFLHEFNGLFLVADAIHVFQEPANSFVADERVRRQVVGLVEEVETTVRRFHGVDDGRVSGTDANALKTKSQPIIIRISSLTLETT